MTTTLIAFQWVSVDRSTLETITKPVDDYVDSFCDQIKLLIPHSFIAKQQSLFKQLLCQPCSLNNL